MSDSDKTHFLAHPEIKELFGSVCTDLVAESDRGAVLVGLAHIDNHLAKLFTAIAPTTLSKKQREQLLEYPGPLGPVSAKVDLALLVRLIPPPLHGAINQLRKLRNQVAHTPKASRLRTTTNSFG